MKHWACKDMDGRGWLRRIDNNGDVYHCSIGVLCELAVEHGVIPESAVDGSGCTYFCGCAKEAPLDVARWAGMWNCFGCNTEDSLTGPSIVRQNDTGNDYSEVIETIKANPPELFTG